MPLETEVLIIGGGIGGLWLLDDLRRAGYDALLVESGALGSGQTINSQGILHGGLKHALVGRIGGFVDALKEMPALWKECLAGSREPDLHEVNLRSEHCYCWRTDSLASTLGQMGARLSLRTGIHEIKREERPSPLAQAPGDVYQLDEQVVDPHSLLTVLANRNRSHIIQATVLNGVRSSDGQTTEFVIVGACGNATDKLMIHPRFIVLTAGAGNEDLASMFKLPPLNMQKLPLSILVLRGNLPTLNGFCIDGAKAKAVVTTQRVSEGEVVWQVASEKGEDIWHELQQSLPGFTWPKLRSAVTVAVRAEPDGNGRSNDAEALVRGNVIVGWPTKMVLAPRLSRRIMDLLPPPQGGDSRTRVADWPRPPIAPFPWF